MRARAGLLLIALTAGSMSPAAHGQDARAAQEPDRRPPVTFRSDINFVEIDAIVTDSHGRFVPGLHKDDFTISEEGTPQPITAFQLVEISRGVRPASASGEQPVPDVATNREALSGRLFLLLLDDLQTDQPNTQRVRQAVRQFVERHVAAGDVVSITFTSARGGSQDFTADRARLLAAVDRFTGQKLQSATQMKAEDLVRQKLQPRDFQKPPEDTREAERALRAKTSLETLRTLAEYLAGIRGRRKSLIYFGEGIDYDFRSTVSPELVSITRDVTGITDSMREAISAATRGNVSFYTIDPRGLPTGDEQAVQLPTAAASPRIPVGNTTVARADVSASGLSDELARAQQVLRSLAEQTGGVPFLNTNDVTAAFERILEDSSHFYVLGYHAPGRRNDGRFRRVEIRVTRPGMNVRARQGYYAPRDTRTAKRAQGKGSAELLEALRSPLPLEGLHVSLAAVPFKGTGSNASVAMVIEVDPARLAFSEGAGTHNTDLELHVAARDPAAGVQIPALLSLAQLRLRPQTYETVKAEGVRLTRRLDLPPGRYRVHLGIREAIGGGVGTLFTDLDVPDFTAAPLALSGVVIVSAAATRVPTIDSDAALTALLPGDQTARRVFPPNDTLVIFAEVYVNDLTRPHVIRVTSSVRNEAGMEVFSAPAEHDSTTLATVVGDGKAAGFGHRVTIPAARLGPGRYVLRVQAQRSIDDAPVMREVPLQIR